MSKTHKKSPLMFLTLNDVTNDATKSPELPNVAYRPKTSCLLCIWDENSVGLLQHSKATNLLICPRTMPIAHNVMDIIHMVSCLITMCSSFLVYSNLNPCCVVSSFRIWPEWLIWQSDNCEILILSVVWWKQHQFVDLLSDRK